MKYKRIIALFACAVIILNTSLASVAALSIGEAVSYVAAPVLEWLAVVALDSAPAAKEAADAASNDPCSDSPTGHHDFSKALSPRPGAPEYYQDTCQYCGVTYSSFYDTAYGAYVEGVEDEYGATGFTDSGSLFFYMNHDHIRCRSTSTTAFCACSNNVLAGLSISTTCAKNSNAFDFSFVTNSAKPYYAMLSWSFTAPVAGVYTLYNATLGSSFLLNGNPSVCTVSSNVPATSITAGTNFTVSVYIPAESKATSYNSISGNSGQCVVSCVPAAGIVDITNDAFINTSTRPTSITGNYGIIGDDGSLTKIDSTTIVNEGSSTYYNPVTNTSYDLSGWTYDYSTRTYNLTTADDNSVTVTYGDENITINEGDTTYNVYYLVEAPETEDDSSGSGSTGEDHTHNYTSEITTAASCLLPGIRTYTCSCGDTYTKSIPATGHAWAISQQVNTTYDPDTGELLQQGYTVYVCNTCGDQYKDESGTGPPNGSSGDSDSESIWDKLGNLIGTIFDGILGLIEGVLGGLLDGLISLATMLADKLAQVVDVIMSLFAEIPAMFTGFLDFLSAVFPFIPEEMMTLLTFGLAAVIFLGILAWFRR